MEKHFIVSGFDGTPEQLIRLLAKGFKRIEYNVDKKTNHRQRTR
ncbi:MAG: hypothetical protein K0S22_1809 [Oscillospiraceae bacterium]|jgi:hypothetical protein|nr:hypothetical protein [Oscillospiraceae bacterium]